MDKKTRRIAAVMATMLALSMSAYVFSHALESDSKRAHKVHVDVRALRWVGARWRLA